MICRLDEAVRIETDLDGVFSPTNEQTWALLVLDRWLERHADF